MTRPFVCSRGPASAWHAASCFTYGPAVAAAVLAFAGTSAAQPPPSAPPPADPPPSAAPPPPPAASPPPANQPSNQPEWTPPGDTDAGGEGNLKDSPLFDPSGKVRHFTLTWNPLTLFVMRAEFALEVMLTDHHVIQLTGFYGGARTNEVYANPSDVSHAHALTTLFQGGGGEVGYRWYSGLAGPRGFFVAPSFLFAHYTATPAEGAGTSTEKQGASIPYWNLGGALDIGWQALLADRFVVGLGAGLQYTVPMHSFPTEELPTSIYANRGLRPRALITFGVAF